MCQQDSQFLTKREGEREGREGRDGDELRGMSHSISRSQFSGNWHGWRRCTPGA